MTIHELEDYIIAAICLGVNREFFRGGKASNELFTGIYIIQLFVDLAGIN